VANAHPHVSCGPDAREADDRAPRVTLVHNGIIENHEELHAELAARGYAFASQTDTEVIVHLIDSLYEGDLAEAVRAAVKRLRGAIPSPCCTATSRSAWWARARVRPGAGSGRRRQIFWPATPWPWPA
jgi:glucosamine 6-phosphate synthetase-like amidotransferase/phosphosugar isomerase protein